MIEERKIMYIDEFCKEVLDHLVAFSNAYLIERDPVSPPKVFSDGMIQKSIEVFDRSPLFVALNLFDQIKQIKHIRFFDTELPHSGCDAARHRFDDISVRCVKLIDREEIRTDILFKEG